MFLKIKNDINEVKLDLDKLSKLKNPNNYTEGIYKVYVDGGPAIPRSECLYGNDNYFFVSARLANLKVTGEQLKLYYNNDIYVTGYYGKYIIYKKNDLVPWWPFNYISKYYSSNGKITGIEIDKKAWLENYKQYINNTVPEIPQEDDWYRYYENYYDYETLEKILAEATRVLNLYNSNDYYKAFTECINQIPHRDNANNYYFKKTDISFTFRTKVFLKNNVSIFEKQLSDKNLDQDKKFKVEVTNLPTMNFNGLSVLTTDVIHWFIDNDFKYSVQTRQDSSVNNLVVEYLIVEVGFKEINKINKIQEKFHSARVQEIKTSFDDFFNLKKISLNNFDNLTVDLSGDSDIITDNKTYNSSCIYYLAAKTKPTQSKTLLFNSLTGFDPMSIVFLRPIGVNPIYETFDLSKISNINNNLLHFFSGGTFFYESSFEDNDFYFFNKPFAFLDNSSDNVVKDYSKSAVFELRELI